MARRAAFICFSALLYPFLIWSRATGNEAVSSILVPLFVFGTLLNAFTCAFRRDQAGNMGLFLAAFVFIFSGDFLINLSPWKKLSPVSFGIAHFLLGLYFTSLTGKGKRDFIAALFVGGASLAFFLRYGSGLPSGALVLVLGGYLSLLSFMMWRAAVLFFSRQLFFTFRSCVFLGALLFYGTDLVVALHNIEPKAGQIIAIWILYPPALFFLSLSSGMKKRYI